MNWTRSVISAFVMSGTLSSLALSLSMQAVGQGMSDVPAPTSAGTPGSSITLPAGTIVEMALLRPVWAGKAKSGDSLYLQTVFPVAIGSRIEIPAGTYVDATIDSITAPTRKLSRAEIDVHFNKLVFANGYTVALSGAEAQNSPATSASGNRPAVTLSAVTVQVSRNNDLLLDNGSQIEMTLEAPLLLDAGQVAQAIPLSHAPAPGSFKPATLCRPTPGDPGVPGTPGTPDTVIPGTPGTPDTVIPGVDGAASTVIPGVPATPSQVIPGSPSMPGTPGTSGTVCPAPPIVLSSAPGGATPPQGVIVKQTPTPAANTTKTRTEQRSQ